MMVEFGAIKENSCKSKKYLLPTAKLSYKECIMIECKIQLMQISGKGDENLWH